MATPEPRTIEQAVQMVTIARARAQLLATTLDSIAAQARAGGEQAVTQIQALAGRALDQHRHWMQEAS